MLKRTFADQIFGVIEGLRDPSVTRIQRGHTAMAHGQKRVKIQPNGVEVVIKVSAPDGKQDITVTTSKPTKFGKKIHRALASTKGADIRLEHQPS